MENSNATEQNVGCLCFVSQLSGINGIIKHKYSDFHVHEIDEEGKIVSLTSLESHPVPLMPDGFETFLNSNEEQFTFTPESDVQTSTIYYDHPELSVSDEGDQVILTKNSRFRPHQNIWKAIMCKENMSDQEALKWLSKNLHIPKANIGVAGTKDKRGITTQYITFRGTNLPLLESFNGSVERLHLGMFQPAMTPLSLGDLAGNHFTILLRDISLPSQTSKRFETFQEAIDKRVKALSEKGFINYFGMQRFGTTSVPTHEIGKLIIKREWLTIIKKLIEPAQNENEQTHKAKIAFQQSHDPRDALDLLPASSHVELALFKALYDTRDGHVKQKRSRDSNLNLSEENPGNPENNNINNNSNNKTSTGKRADPVYIDLDHLKVPAHEIFQMIDRRQRMMYVHAYQSYLWNHVVSKRWEKSGNQIFIGDYAYDQNGKIVEVTAENFTHFSPFDIVIMLPNGDFIPKEAESLLQKDGVTQQLFQRLSSEYGVYGDWRPFLGLPKSVEWSLISHSDRDATLLESDIDKINGISYEENRDGGEFTSLLISFSLEKGMYATMALRELLKRSTEWFSDAYLSNPQNTKLSMIKNDENLQNEIETESHGLFSFCNVI